MADFLALCQRVRQECGVAGTGPASVTGQTGMMQKIVNWTMRSWVDIQSSKPYWKFLRATAVKNLVVGQQDYDLSSDWALTFVDKFDAQGAFIYLTTVANQSQLEWKMYPEFRALYTSGFEDGRPTQITEINGDSVRFNRVPDLIYTVTLDYWMTPEQLVNNTDVPAIPEHYHDVIVWKAVQKFAGAEGAEELMRFARSEYSGIYTQLVLDQMETPPKLKPYPVATGRTNWSGTDTWGS
jgi:hypothetical protein